jgi:hypothetical protein
MRWQARALAVRRNRAARITLLLAEGYSYTGQPSVSIARRRRSAPEGLVSGPRRRRVARAALRLDPAC